MKEVNERKKDNGGLRYERNNCTFDFNGLCTQVNYTPCLVLIERPPRENVLEDGS
jgi:hypothetical protein